MSHDRRPPGWANPRAAPFVGWRIQLTRLHQLYGVKAYQHRAWHNGGSTLDFPTIIQLQTKSGCNASCVYCPQQKIRDMFPEATLSDDLYRSIVEQTTNEPKFHGIGFVLQNEPMIDDSLFDKVRYFREHGKTDATTFLVSNATLLTPDKVSELLSSGLDAMHISCNGLGKEDFEAVNQGKSWEVFTANLEHFLSQDLRNVAVMMSFVRSALYRGELDEAIARWRSRGFRCFVHGINNRGGLVDDYEAFGVPMEQEPLLTRLQKRFMKWFIGCCPYPFIQMSILASGKVLVCTHDWSRRHIIGDLNEQSIREVWNGPVMREARLELLAGRHEDLPACKHCDVFTNATFV